MNGKAKINKLRMSLKICIIFIFKELKSIYRLDMFVFKEPLC